jgi:2-methylisocitrate lyase-like PEP mutase family enzyme
MDMNKQIEKAHAFRRKHDRSRILLLPNAWDAASARIFEEAGFKAIATTSAGIAYVAGYPDGENIPREDMVRIVGWIANSVDVPVTADMEAGFGRDTRDVAETVKATIGAGAVGMNLEDTIHPDRNRLYELPDAVARIRAALTAAGEAGVPIVLNARVDVYLRQIGEPSTRFEHAVRRANSYREAGADCVYIMGVLDTDTIGALARAIDGPINVMGLPNGPTVAELERLGVARVSTASFITRVAMAATQKVATDLLRDGSFDVLGGEAVRQLNAQALMSRRDASRPIG